MSTAESIRHDASMDEYHARKNYEAATKAYEDALGHLDKLRELASNALYDDGINQVDDLCSDITGIFNAAVSSAWEDVR